MSALYVNRYSFHDVALEGRRVLFHIPSSGIFELDELGTSLIDFFKENQQVSFDSVRERFAGAAPPTDLAQTLESFRELSILGEQPATPDASAAARAETSEKVTAKPPSGVGSETTSISRPSVLRRRAT